LANQRRAALEIWATIGLFKEKAEVWGPEVEIIVEDFKGKVERREGKQESW
jgi:hypothetical protein